MAFLDSLFAPPGLLNPEEQAFVRNQGLLNLAGSLLAASGPSPRPVSLGQALGQGLSGMSQAQMQATQGMLGNRLLKTKLDEVEMEKKRQKGLLDLVGAPAGLIANDAQGDEMVDRPGTGFIGGKLTPQQFYAGVAGLGGDYTKLGIGGLSELQKAQIGRSNYYTYFDTPEGIIAADARNPRLIDPVTRQEITNRRVVKSTNDPGLQTRISGGKEYGEKVGASVAAVGGKYDALDSIKEARSMLNKGIYSGFWGETQKTLAKATPGIDKTKAANTEQFMSYIGNVVIPRLQEFGGNDSNEELRYLQRVMGGEISMEDKALVGVLEDAERKTRTGIERLRKQAKDIGRTPPASPPSDNSGWSIRKK